VPVVPVLVITTCSVFHVSPKSVSANNSAHIARISRRPRAGDMAAPDVIASSSYIATVCSSDLDAIALAHTSSACRMAASSALLCAALD
jgi:hypothetical protein